MESLGARVSQVIPSLLRYQRISSYQACHCDRAATIVPVTGSRATSPKRSLPERFSAQPIGELQKVPVTLNPAASSVTRGAMA